MIRAVLVLLITAVPWCIGHGQRIGEEHFVRLVRRCAPNAAIDTMLAVARTESSLNASALSVNRPRRAARVAGYERRRLILARQPKDRDEAVRWMNWLLSRKYTVSVGLMQINVENAARLGIQPADLFDPCTNIRVSAQLLSQFYAVAPRGLPESQAILRALSQYNSGSPLTGFTNGYVHSVLRRARRASRK